MRLTGLSTIPSTHEWFPQVFGLVWCQRGKQTDWWTTGNYLLFLEDLGWGEVGGEPWKGFWNSGSSMSDPCPAHSHQKESLSSGNIWHVFPPNPPSLVPFLAAAPTSLGPDTSISSALCIYHLSETHLSSVSPRWSHYPRILRDPLVGTQPRWSWSI